MSDEFSQPRSVFTVGHSNHSIEKFIELLRGHDIEVLVDTRSSPYSRYAAQFNSDSLKASLAPTGMRYLYLGKELGGRPEGSEFYDAEGHALYDRMAASRPFLQAIARLVEGVGKHRIALLCSEENPASCHRRLLIGKVLAERGIQSLHIRGDGRIQPEDELAREEQTQQDNLQQPLFAFEPSPEWKSTQSVLAKRQRPSSSNR